MFENIGKKIKGLAKVVAYLGMIASVIGGISIMADGSDVAILIGLLVMISGMIAAWIGSFFAYGFGQLVDNSDKLVKAQKVNNVSAECSEKVVINDKVETLKKWKEEGLISEEEYNEKMNRI